MEVKLNALVIKAVDYKDNDKILTLYSLERGKITASIKGVKKSGAKLKFASEPFAFCEFILAEKMGRYTVIGASYIDSFFSLRTNLIKYYVSSIIMETTNRLTVENEPNDLVFKSVINAVKKVNYEDNELITLANFLLEMIDFSGYKIFETACSCCGDDIDGRVFFSTSSAEFYCLGCRTDNSMEITLETYKTLKKFLKTDYIGIESSALLKFLRFLFFYVEFKTETKIKSFEALLDFLKNN